ncbi:MAG: formylmethanofuran dehydrogenase subunit E family protein, partial [Desulfobacteraceae bacterium]|nr:formylmethanofuran dehydrogenase subunit E family protein [Desulfobacteraceae bacterium]
MKDFDTLLKNSATAHGHLCPGQVVGVRMAMLGCWLIGLDVPTRIDQIKKLIVFVE